MHHGEGLGERGVQEAAAGLNGGARSGKQSYISYGAKGAVRLPKILVLTRLPGLLVLGSWVKSMRDAVSNKKR